MMFTPKAFKEDSFETIQAFIKEQPLATVMAQMGDGLEACHIPMYWQDDGSEFGCLYGHIAKVNELNISANLAAPWLIIFQDAGHYISPNWYPSKAVTHKEVPTPCVRIVVTPNNQVKGCNKEQRCPDTVKRENKLY